MNRNVGNPKLNEPNFKKKRKYGKWRKLTW